MSLRVLICLLTDHNNQQEICESIFINESMYQFFYV